MRGIILVIMLFISIVSKDVFLQASTFAMHYSTDHYSLSGVYWGCTKFPKHSSDDGRELLELSLNSSSDGFSTGSLSSSSNQTLMSLLNATSDTLWLGPSNDSAITN